MKNQITSATILILLFAGLILNSCKKEETLAPGTGTSDILSENMALSRPTEINKNLPASIFAGAYTNATDTCLNPNIPPCTFNATITLSTTVSNGIIIQNFGAFGNSVMINASFYGYSIIVPVSQTLYGGLSVTAATGSVISATAPVKFRINYTWTDGIITETCKSTYTHN